MASIRREFLIDARPTDVWEAVRDIGALHTRLVPGFVTACRLEPGARTRAVWTADLLPDEMAKPIAAMIDQGCAVTKKTLERG
ncbi:MAG TPA: SRPBCC family protein [Burkholderiales bacterium]|jgi:hypothetical protein